MTIKKPKKNHVMRSSYLEEEAESNPLVVLDVLLIPLVSGLVHAGVGHVHANTLPVRRTQRVRGMDPTVCVEHLFGNFLGMNTHDGGANVLPGGDYECEGEQDHDGEPVV
jgi:hypothetical protein